MQIQKAEPLHHQVYHILKQLIIQGEYQAGERLIELKIAEKLGTSRAPVREAIRMLVQDGLLIQKDGALSVFNPNAHDIREFYQCRQALESLAARLAASQITDAQLLKLESNIAKTKEALKKEDVQEISAYDQQFHDSIAMYSGNAQLIQLYEVLKIKSIFIRSNIIRNYYKNFTTFSDEHEQIFHALAQRDPHLAEQEMRAHLQKNLDASFTLIANQ